jgi:iron complex transport system substrate-binding protein
MARAPKRRRRFLGWRLTGLLALLIAGAGAAAPLPRVASINLCADQLVLAIADPAQIVTVSWLAADAEESLAPELAAQYPLNYGSAEELLGYHPDVVIAGEYTNGFTRALLKRLGYRVIELPPETSIAAIETNLRTVAQAIGRAAEGEAAIEALRARAHAIGAHRRAATPRAVVLRPGGFTVGADTLADSLMALAGARNVAAEQGLDRWGSLSIEALVRSAPELLILTDYRRREPSLASAVLDHPVLAEIATSHRTVSVRAAYWACGLPQSLESAAQLQRALGP